MKKYYVILFLLCACFMSGCVKNYKTVDEYSDAMKKISDANTSYTIDLNIGMNEEQNLSTKIYSKAGKWKAVSELGIPDMPKMYYMFNGQKTLSFYEGSKTAIEVPKNKTQNNLPFQENINPNDDPAFALFNWNDAMKEFNKTANKLTETAAPQVPKEYISKNGFECRLIKYSDNIEACINEQYGIAVYERFVLDKAIAKKQKFELTFNVTGINTDEIPDSEFELPRGVKIMSLKDMQRSLKARSRF